MPPNNTFQDDPSTTPLQQHKIQFIDFTYCNDKFFYNFVAHRFNKYHLLITNTHNISWNTQPLIVITICLQDTTCTPYIQSHHQYHEIDLHFVYLKSTFSNINNIATKFSTCKILYKLKLENNQILSNIHELSYNK